MKFYPGLDVTPLYEPMGFQYGKGVFGPNIENRKLDDIRKSLLDPNCNGPDIIYSIAMDVGKEKDKEGLYKRNLLFGIVSYAKGKLGKEPVRSQGHVHAVSKSCNSSTPEVYEIWSGEAIVYMQETDDDNPGRCFAVYAKRGDVVIVPPYWAHYAVNANPDEEMTFGAWCVRDYGYVYDGVRKHHGLAWYPLFDENNKIKWIKNKNYNVDKLDIRTAREYKEFSIEKALPIYTQYENNPDKFLFVSKPSQADDIWQKFEP